MELKKQVLSWTTEDGSEKLSIADYEAKAKLRKLFGRQSTPPIGRRTLWLGRNVFSYSDEYLKQAHRVRSALDDAERMYLANPLKYFIPHEQTVVDFLNWRADDGMGTFKVLHAGTGSGKTWAGAACWLLDIVPTEANWPIFTFGVKRRAHKTYDRGGIAIVTYQRQNHENTIWPQVIAKLCPREHIEDYLTGKKSISWRMNPKCEIAGTPIFFLVSSQKDTAFVSQALDIFHWDEQHTESKFMNANDRVQRRGGRHIMTMTPHKVDGIAESGAGSFVDRIRKGELDTSLDVRFFQMDYTRVNEWVVTKEDKEDKLEEWIHGPTRQKNYRKLAEGRSKVYGEFHESSGLVVDNYSAGIHLVPPFEVPKHWTWYRFHDHGRKEPNACLLVAVDENDTPFIIKEYYERDVEIADAAAGIIEMCGNTVTDKNGFRMESMTGRLIRYTRSDPRSLSKALDNSPRTIQQEYQKHGLNLSLGTGERPVNLVGLLTAMFEVDPGKRHYATREMGAPGIYISTECPETIKELTNWRYKTRRVGGAAGIRMEEVPEPKNDHAMTCLLLMAADRPLWIPTAKKKGLDGDSEDGVVSRRRADVCQVTGY